jgi:hypothetical protein
MSPGVCAPEGPSAVCGCCIPNASDQPRAGPLPLGVQLSVDRFVLVPAVKRLGKAVLPR